MTKIDKQYTIYIRSANLRVPCTKDQFDAYYRDINAYRRTQMNHGRCVCPPSKGSAVIWIATIAPIAQPVTSVIWTTTAWIAKATK